MDKRPDINAFAKRYELILACYAMGHTETVAKTFKLCSCCYYPPSVVMLVLFQVKVNGPWEITMSQKSIDAGL